MAKAIATASVFVPLATVATPFYSEGMLVVVWIVFLFFMLFVLGSVVGSFLNVCIVRLPRGRSLIRPASRCGQCGKLIRWQDNIPLLSYWLLRGRCRNCGTSFSMRYFWIELLTGIIFVSIYYLEIGRNIHHFQLLYWYEDDFEFLLTEMFRPRPWLVFAVHALLSCFLIVAAMTTREHHQTPRSVTSWGLFVGLLAAVLFPWPWPDEAAQAIALQPGDRIYFGREIRPYAWGPRVGPMPVDSPWGMGDVTPRAGLYPWPVWGPLPDWLPAGDWRLGLATGLAGILAGAAVTGLVRLLFNIGVGVPALGTGEMSLLMIAGGFLGWQPVVVTSLLGLVPGLIAATIQWRVGGRQQVAFSFWLALAVAAVGLGWYWIGPLVQGLFFNATRLLLFAADYGMLVVAYAACARLLKKDAGAPCRGSGERRV
ncbi:MAG: prepilin peptidase [Gemmataceae bacterium]